MTAPLTHGTRVEPRQYTSKETYDGLMQIAANIAAYEPPWLNAWDELASPKTSAMEAIAALKRATDELNAAIAPHVERIADLTHNSRQTLLQSCHPREELEVWFGDTGMPPSRFLQNVARWRSFNRTYWAAKEQEIELQALLERAPHGDAEPVLCARLAADAILAGQVPLVSEAVAARPYTHVASPLEQKLFLLRVLDHHLNEDITRWRRLRAMGAPIAQHVTGLDSRLTPTSSIAWVQVGADGERTFVFWPAKRTFCNAILRPIDPHAANDSPGETGRPPARERA